MKKLFIILLLATESTFAWTLIDYKDLGGNSQCVYQKDFPVAVLVKGKECPMPLSREDQRTIEIFAQEKIKACQNASSNVSLSNLLRQPGGQSGGFAQGMQLGDETRQACIYGY